ncbi:MAG: PD-(D/E)XK nuclease family protein [Sterolibacterium sp.]
MLTPDSPLDFEQARISLAALAGDAVVLSVSQRLAHNLRRDHVRTQVERGLSRWQPLQVLTPAQWLAAVMSEAMLSGGIALASAPRMVLSPMQERILWERAIGALGESEGEVGSVGAPEDTLFDREGLAGVAAEANELLLTWRIRLPAEAALQSEETRQFLAWREEFRRICAMAGWLEPARHLDWQLDCLEAGAGRLPQQLVLAGFDRYNPQEERLARALMARGVAVYELEQGLPAQAAASVLVLPERNAECRAAAAWAQRQLAENPAARLGIVVPELGALRETLAALLDDALDPAAVSPALAEMPRRYNFSLGLPLARQALVTVALQWLDLAAQPRRIGLEAFGALLRQPYWSSEQGEAQARALLDARMREYLAPTVTLERLIGFADKAVARGLAVPRLLAHLEAFKVLLAAQPARQTPTVWAQVFERLLAAIGWPGERSLSSHEYQAKRAFGEVLEGLVELEPVLGRVSLAEASRRLAQLCRERIFQPQTAGDPPVQVMGLLEGADTPLDALWVMGMNDHLWPPAPRPNPLLPAELLRRVRAPNACAAVQSEFANVIQRRLLRSAAQVCFSWARSEAGRELRPSPLIAGIAEDNRILATTPTLAESLVGSAALETFVDAQAPPVAANERVGGGTKLLQAQAICPAWAFYRYRLGAKALEIPTEGLDARARGNLLHAVLERFWQGRGLHDLLAMAPSARDSQVAAAVDGALVEFVAAQDDALPPRLRALERERLIFLVLDWLELEAQRPAAFRVIEREQDVEIDIEGIMVRLRVDRIDELDDGRRVIIDYKTGGAVSQASWAAQRIDEPQLPIYAALLPARAYDATAAEGVAGVVFAKVRLEENAFIGVAAESGLLPKVAGLAEARRIYPEPQFPDWDSLFAHWRTRIAAIAREVREGCAAVSFADERKLAYCEVKPLLRLAERKAQSDDE